MFFEVWPNKAKMGYIFGMIGGSLLTYFLLQGQFVVGIILAVIIAILFEVYCKKFGAEFGFKIVIGEEQNNPEEIAKMLSNAFKDAIEKTNNKD